jgi:hypothetical protein
VRQRLRGCSGGADGFESTFVLKGMGDLNGMVMDNLRKGMDDLIKIVRERGFEGNFPAEPAFI